MKSARWMALGLALLLAAGSAVAQKRDALTEKEADQLRETAQEPAKRLHLLMTFARARMEAIDHLRSDQNMAVAQSDKVSELLDDVASIVDEIDDNLTQYDSQGEDLRKALREVIEMDSDFQLKLRAIKETTEKGPKKVFTFAVDNAIESVNASADSARKMLDDENAKKGKEKIEKENKSAKKDTPAAKPTKEKKTKPDYTGIGNAGQQPPK